MSKDNTLALIVPITIVIVCLLIFASYHTFSYIRAESQSRDRELAFQKEKEKTRKAEFDRLLEIREKEERGLEELRRRERIEAREKEYIKQMNESSDRQMALIMEYMEAMSNNPYGTISTMSDSGD